MKLNQVMKIARSGKVCGFSERNEIEGLAAFCLFNLPRVPLEEVEKGMKLVKKSKKTLDVDSFIRVIRVMSLTWHEDRKQWRQNPIFKELTRESHRVFKFGTISSAFICNKCGQAVPAKGRSRHLMEAHKLSGYHLGQHFRCMGKPYQPWMRGYTFDGNTPIPKERKKMVREWDPDLICGSNPKESTYVKIIYTPMGNRR